MDLNEKRFLVAGATGELGGRLARALAADGAHVAVAGRDAARLGTVASELGAPAIQFDLEEPGDAHAAVAEAAEKLGGLDGLVIATGAVAFGGAADVDDVVSAQLMRINALGPIELIHAALPVVERPGAIVALSAVVAEHATAGMASYSASKAALTGYLAALRREERRNGLSVLDVRPQHIATGFEERALQGDPPPLDPGVDPDAVVAAILDALRDDRRELAYDLQRRELVAA